MIRLTEEDGQAVDWYLWARSAARQLDVPGEDARLNALPETIRERVAAFARLFDALGTAPEPELPPGLAARTINAIERGVLPSAVADDVLAAQRPPDIPASS